MSNQNVEDIEAAFSEAMAEQGYGDHQIPADGEWYGFSFPDNSSGHESGRAKINASNGKVEGVVLDFRTGKSPIFVWTPEEIVVTDAVQQRMKEKAAERKTEQDRVRIE